MLVAKLWGKEARRDCDINHSLIRGLYSQGLTEAEVIFTARKHLWLCGMFIFRRIHHNGRCVMTGCRRCSSARIELVRSSRPPPSSRRPLSRRPTQHRFRTKTISCRLRRRDVTSNSSTRASESSTEQQLPSTLSPLIRRPIFFLN